MKRLMMHTVVLVVVVGAAACTKASAPDTSSSPSAATAVGTVGQDVEATITQLERDWVAAIVKKDTATLDRILADDYNGTTPTAFLYSKRMAIDDISKGTYAVDSMDLDEISVNVYGDTAVSFTSQEEKSRYDGRDLSGHYHYTDVWVKRDGRWQTVASHGSRFDTKDHED
jgi:ketosteroid isomerase-like protein